MFQVKHRIVIYQTPSPRNSDGSPGAFPNRNKIYELDFVTSVEIVENWKNLTQTAKITFPKNIYVNQRDPSDPTGSLITWYGADTKNMGGFLNNEPILLRGDRVDVFFGYDELIPEFSGYVSAINVKMPVTVELEDSMWFLKQVQCPNKLWKGTEYSLNDVLAEVLAPTGFTFVSGTASNPITVNVGDIRTQNETVCQLLDRLKKDVHLYFYFSPKNKLELRGGFLVYYPQDYIDSNGEIIYNDFIFQQTIISDDLKYSRKDDIFIGARCYSLNKTKHSKNSAKGGTKESTTRLEVTVGNMEPKGGGDSEVFSFWFPNVTSESELKKLGQAQLDRYYYAGLRGKYKTFAQPSVHMGMIARLTEPDFLPNNIGARGAMPERNGSYLIRSVKKNSSVTEGVKQEIELHFRIDEFSQAQLQNGL